MILNTLDKYDVIHLIHSRESRTVLPTVIHEHGLTYAGAPYQKALMDLLLRSSARVYVVEDEFTFVPGQMPEQRNIDIAIDTIRKKDPHAKIVLYSDRTDIRETAQRLHAEFCEKSLVSPTEFVSYLELLLTP